MIIIYLHGFDYPDQRVKPQKVKLTLDGAVVKDIAALNPSHALEGVDLEPESFAEIFSTKAMKIGPW